MVPEKIICRTLLVIAFPELRSCDSVQMITSFAAPFSVMSPLSRAGAPFVDARLYNWSSPRFMTTLNAFVIWVAWAP